MIERLTPEEYERRRVTDTSAQDEELESQLAEERKVREYVYGAEPEPVPEEPEPQVEYVPVEEEPPLEEPPITEAPAETRIPWGLIGIIAITGLIALGIVAVVASKK